jgi:hypothetical protein
MPAFELTVPTEFYRVVANVSGEDFADSYLWGATLSGKVLMLRTLTAYNAIMGASAVLRAIHDDGVKIEKPSPWPGDGSRMSVANDLPGYIPAKKKSNKEW